MKDFFFFFWKKRYWQLSRWETGHLVWSGPHLYMFQVATFEGEMKPCHHRLSVSHVLTCLGQFLLTFSLFFFLASVSMHWSTKGQKIRDIVNFCIVSSQRHLFSSSIWPFGQKWKREKKKRTKPADILTSGLCPITVHLFYGSGQWLLFQHALSLNCFQSICLDASTFFWKILLALYYLTSETASPISICSGEVFNTAAHIWCHSVKDMAWTS